MSASVEANRRALQEDLQRRAVHVDGMPTLYHVHLNMPCNQKCIMCVPDGRHKKDLIPFERVRALIEQFRPYAEHVTLIGGEPLIYPWIDGTLALLARESIAVSVNSNVTRLDDAMARRLLTLNELYLRCSIDAATRNTYYRIRGTDTFDLVTANIARFATLARAHPRAYLIPIYVVMRENLHEVLPFIELARAWNPLRIEFHPVRHVDRWMVENGTGWMFEGRTQICESFRDEYNDVMRRAAARCAELGLDHEVRII